MSELLLKSDLSLLNDRICNLAAGLATMPESGTMQVSKAFLTAILGYMEELHGMRRVQPATKPLTLRFGSGDIGVSTCRQENSDTWNELLLWNPHMRQDIGDSIPIAEGTTTDDVEVFARLIFLNADSAQVVSDALNRIIDSSGGNRPLTLEQLREMAGEPVWVVDTKHPEDSGWMQYGYYSAEFYMIAFWMFGNEVENTYSVDNYGKTWLAYRRPPERSKDNA